MRNAAFIRCWNSAPCASNHFSTSSSTLRVTAVFLLGIRHSALAKNSSPKGGISEVSISSSDMLSIRAQSVSEGLCKLLSLMFQRLSQRDNPYHVFAAFGENHNHYSVPEKTNSVQTVFAISLSRIKSHPRGRFKDFPSIGEVKAVLADILFVLFLIPFKVHRQSLIARRLS